jgi:hypothetical protein
MLTVNAVRGILEYFIVPLWLAAGIADWLCHRVSHIERNAGAKESIQHLVMLGEIGIPLCAALFLQINALIIALMIGAYLVHQLTALWDLRYAITPRFTGPSSSKCTASWSCCR